MNLIDDAHEAIPHVAIRDLRVHKKLVERILILLAISIFFLGAISLDLFEHRIDATPVIEVWLLGFALGITIFARIRRVRWDEDAAMVSVAAMDRLGFLILALYYLFDFALEPFFYHVYHDATIVKGLLFALIFGTIAGRLANFAIAIYRTHQREH